MTMKKKPKGANKRHFELLYDAYFISKKQTTRRAEQNLYLQTKKSCFYFLFIHIEFFSLSFSFLLFLLSALMCAYGNMKKCCHATKFQYRGEQ